MSTIPRYSAEDSPFGAEGGSEKQFIYAHANAKCVALVRPHPKAAPGFLYLSDVQCLNFEVCTGSKVGKETTHVDSCFAVCIFDPRRTFPTIIYSIVFTTYTVLRVRYYCAFVAESTR